MATKVKANLKTLVLILLFAGGCVEDRAPQKELAGGKPGEPRVIRLLFTRGEVRLAVNNPDSPTMLKTFGAFTNALQGLHLGFGDLIIMGSPQFADNAVVRWLRAHSRSNRVSVYAHAEFKPELAQQVLELTVFHWKASPDEPMKVEEAVFYKNGLLLGDGLNGIEQVFTNLVEAREKRVFLCGSRWDMGRSFPPDASPFENHRKELEVAAQRAGTTLIIPDPELGF